MDTTARTRALRITATAAALLVFVSIAFPAPAKGAQPVTVIGASTEETALVNWAIDQYDAAGIDIRPVTVIFHRHEAGSEPCYGGAAYYRIEDRTIDMCNSSYPHHQRRHFILHELGHTHTFGTMSLQDIEAFVEQSGSHSWNDYDHQWHHRGEERAADIVAWGLNPDPAPIQWMQELSCQKRADLLHTLTGSKIVHDEC